MRKLQGTVQLGSVPSRAMDINITQAGLLRKMRSLSVAVLLPVSRHRALQPGLLREVPEECAYCLQASPRVSSPPGSAAQAWTGCKTAHARSCGALQAARPASPPEAAWHIRVGPRPAVGARHLLRDFPSFINELWQQPCELGLGWRHGLGEAGQAWPLASRGLSPTAGRCSVLPLTAGLTPQCLSVQSQTHALKAKAASHRHGGWARPL